MAVLIEFAGPSCAGKSTLISALTNERADWEKCEAAAVAGCRDILWAIMAPYLTLWVLINPRLAFTAKGRQLLGAIGLVARIKRRDGVFLIDEGPIKLHQLWSLRSARGVSFLRRAIPKPDVLVVVTCKPEIRLARLRATGRLHARALTDEEIRRRETGDRLALQFAKERDVPIIEVDTSSDRGLPKNLLLSLCKLVSESSDLESAQC